MKVYHVETDFTPKSGRYREYAALNCDEKHTVIDDVGRGQRFPRWKSLEFFFDNPSCPRSDFMWLSSDLVCNQRARDVVGSILERSGELLPVTIEREAGNFYLYNCTTILKALNPSDSIYETTKKDQWTELIVPSFKPNRLIGEEIFKFQEMLSSFFVVEHDDISLNTQFRSLVEANGLTGLKFNLV
jgi:hypothetical protein